MLLYHKTRARIAGWFLVLRRFRHVLRGDSDLGRKNLVIIYYRLAHSRYWDKVTVRQPCGCYAYRGYFTSYVSDCPEHGLDAIFGEYFKEDDE